jgi:hypothetical protein
MFKFNSVPAYSFGKSLKPDIGAEQQPGPGAYNTERTSQLIYKQGKTTAILRPESSRPASKTVNIGPGQYDCNRLPQRVKGYYFTSSTKKFLENKSIGPGPGRYDYEEELVKLKSKSGKFLFNRSARIESMDKFQMAIPGPGKYLVEKLSPALEKFKNNSGFYFSKSRKDDLVKVRTSSPGPGAYDTETITALNQKGKGFSLPKSNSRPGSALTEIPGPGSYRLSDSLKTMGIVFGRESRQSLSKKDLIPGPGVYDATINPSAFKKSPEISFGKEIVKFVPSNIPGPGKYTPKQSSIDERGIIFAKEKRDMIKENEVPGPGNYNVAPFYKISKSTFRFGTEPKGKNERIDSPGPGAYNPVKPSLISNVALPHAPRSADPRSEVPGPGKYNIKNTNWDKNVLRFIRLETKERVLSANVGPGMYDIPHSIPDVPKYNYPDSDRRKIRL